MEDLRLRKELLRCLNLAFREGKHVALDELVRLFNNRASIGLGKEEK